MPELNEALFQKSEAPDFLLRYQGHIVGIEHTLFSTDQTLLRFEKETDQILLRAQKHFESHYDLQLIVRVMWNDAHWKIVTRDEKEFLIEAISDFVKEHFTGDQSVSFDWHSFYEKGLDEWVAFLDIVYLGDKTRSSWTSARSGVIGSLSTARIEQIIHDKGQKYEACTQKCDECWLLIYGPTAGMSSMILFDESIEKLSQQQFTTNFERVFYFDGWSKNVIELRVAPSPSPSSGTLALNPGLRFASPWAAGTSFGELGTARPLGRAGSTDPYARIVSLRPVV